MTDKSSATVPIIVAVIGVAGTITATLIANWDKVSGGRAQTSASPAAAQEVRNAAAASGGRSDVVQPAVAPSLDVSGTWTDGGLYRFIFTQRGDNTYSFREFKRGVPIGSGDGVLNGHSFRHDFQSDEVGNGTCTGEVSADGNVSSGTCSNGTNTWGMRVFRTPG